MPGVFLMAYGLASAITSLKFAFDLWDLGSKKYLYISKLMISATLCGLIQAITNYVQGS